MTGHDWFEVQRLPHAVTMIREPHHAEDVKSYLIEGSRDVAVLDTGLGVGDFAGLVHSLSSKPPRVLQTHAHWDHIGGSHTFDDVRVHPTEAAGLRAGFPSERYAAAFTEGMVDRDQLPDGFDSAGGLPGREPTGWLHDGDRIDLGDRVLEVVHTPGHSPGGVSFLDRAARALFVGDLLYLGWMYLFFPEHSSPAAFRQSLSHVMGMLDDIDTIYPAHGPSPITKDDAVAVRDAFELVWQGRAPGGPDALFGFALTRYDFDRFAFLLPEGDWRSATG